jgi:predicted phage terminase large subunit-like protein
MMISANALPYGALDVLLRNDMASFVRASFAQTTPGVDLVWNPYLDLISARLADVVSGKTRNLIVTMPPRHLKSVCVSVALSAFFLGHNPGAEVMAVSYGQELARQFAEDTRKVMTSAFYRRIFETRLASTRQQVHALRTTQGGIRRATSIEGAATGVGADLLIFDDPQKPGEITSDTIRRATNEAYETTFLSRRNDPAKCRTVIVMQRIHEDDFVAHVQELGGDWEVLNLPAIAEVDESYDYTTFMGRHVYRRKAGEALHPGRIPLEELAKIRTGMGEAAFATQYMQRPSPAGGGLVKPEWFGRYDPSDLPNAFDQVIQSWDTANTIAQWSDFSVCTTWGLKDKRIFLLGIYRQRLIYPDLKRAVFDQAQLHQPTSILIEDRASGTQLIQDLQRDGVARIHACKPTADKRMRMSAVTAVIEQGLVLIPREVHWLQEYLHELTLFPNGRYDDQVDSTSQALGWIGNPGISSWGLLQLMQQERDGLRNRCDPHAVEPTWAPGSMEWTAQQAALKAAA